MLKIKQAKEIPIQLYVERLGAKLFRENAKEIIYYSPFRDEKTASFHVRKKLNMFIDFGDGRGQGDILDLHCDANNRNRRDPEAIKQALIDLEYLSNIPAMVKLNISHEPDEPSDHYVVESLSDRITDKHLRKEMSRRGITLSGEYIKQAKVKTKTGKKFNVFGMENIKGGTELHMHYPDQINPDFRDFKKCVGPKDVTVYPARHDIEDVTAYAFSSKWDFETHIHEEGRKPDITYVIYHGDSMTRKCADYIISDKDRIKEVMHFDHNDEAGQKADARLALLLQEGMPDGFVFGKKGDTYKGTGRTAIKDLSEWKMKHPYSKLHSKAVQKEYRVPHPGQAPGRKFNV